MLGNRADNSISSVPSAMSTSAFGGGLLIVWGLSDTQAS